MWIWVVLAVTVAAALALVAARMTSGWRPGDGWALRQRDAERSREAPGSTSGADPAPAITTDVDQDEGLYPGLPDNHLLTSSPMVDWRGMDLPLRDWLRHAAGDGVWSSVVTDFYGRAAEDPDVASYFRGVDMTTLQRHFVAALMLVSGHGVSVGVVRRMRRAHIRVVNERGEPIDESTWHKVIGTLVAVLQDHGVPDATIGSLAVTIEPLKRAVVIASDRGDTP